jgi:hypothetical protein
MERIFTATDDGYYFVPKKAMTPTVKSAPGNHHNEVEGNPLLERRVGAFGRPHDANYRIMGIAPEAPEGHEFWSDVPNLEEHPELWAQECPYTIPKHGGVYVEKIVKEAAVEAQPVDERQPLHDDSGAATGLRRRPDYGESDSITTRLNNGNSKGASAQYVIALAATSRKEASKTATMYVTGIEWDGLKVASFKFGSDASKAVRLPNLTAKAVSQQLFAPPFEVKARPVPTASLQSK